MEAHVKSLRWLRLLKCAVLLVMLTPAIFCCSVWLLLNGIWTVFRVDTDPIQCAVFFPDGRRILVAYPDNTLRVCDIETGAESYQLDGQCHCSIVSIAVAPDGRFAVSTSNGLGEPAPGFGTWKPGYVYTNSGVTPKG